MGLQRQLRVLNDDNTGMDAGVKVAFATGDLKHVDQHFGSAERFAIYTVGGSHTRLLEVAEFGTLSQDGDENKLLEKFAVLDGCAAVYSQAIGPSAVRQLVGLGVQPLKVPPGTAIGALIEGLQHELREGASGWLQRARSGRKDAERFDAMEREGWEE